MIGKFITFEGPDGSGKTTIINAVKKHLEEAGYGLITTREPGGIKISEEIREIILSTENIEMDAHTEALLYAASRSQHYNEKIVPALNDNKIILCDRFVDSSMAYQGHARGLGIDKVYAINKFAIGETLPDLTLFIDVPPSVGLERVYSSTRKADRLDLESLEFHEKVYEGYMIITKKFSDRIVTIDGTQKVEEVIKDAITAIENIL